MIAGEPWPGAVGQRAAVLRLAAELDVEDRLRLIGFREGVEAVYAAADVIVVPSTEPDPLPAAAIEAGAAGCAVIASATGGLPEIISDGQTGRLVEPGDSASLSRTAAELIDNSSERERLGAAAADDIRARFDPRRLLDALHDLYDGALDGS